MNKRLFSIILVVFIDLLGFSLILPLLPYYAETFKANETTTGILIASYTLMQQIGAWAPGAFGAIVMVGVSVYVFITIYNHPIVATLNQKQAVTVSE